MKKLIFLMALANLALFGCAKNEPQPEENTASQYVTHTVQFEGETLGLISKWYTGNTGNWKAIKAANPELEPKAIKIGQVINIPATLTVTSEPLPRKYIREQAKKVKIAEEAPKVVAEEKPAAEAVATEPIKQEQVEPKVEGKPVEEAVEVKAIEPEKPVEPAEEAQAENEGTAPATLSDIDSPKEEPEDVPEPKTDEEREKLLKQLLEK